MEIILASSSPRRQALMRQIGLSFTVRVSHIKEKHDKESPLELVESLSIQKATAVLHELECEAEKKEAVIIGADTIVSLQGKVFGKPDDEQEAFQMLKELQGKSHTVHTGVALIFKSNNGNKLTSFVESAHVIMRPLSNHEIHAYVKTGEPLDKAGAYGIQEKGALWVEKIEGDFYTVMGLPLARLYSFLREFHIGPVWVTEKEERR